MTSLPRIQQAQYGDKVAIDKLGSVRKTNDPAATSPMMKEMAGGRPVDPEKLALAAAQQATGQAQQLPPEMQRYQELFNELAIMQGTATKLMRIAAQPGAGPLTKAYALAAMREYSRFLMQVRSETPFFDES